MSALDLLADTPNVADQSTHGPIFKRWMKLFESVINVVKSFDEIPFEWVHMYHRKESASSAIETWIDITRKQLTSKGRDYTVCRATDLMKFKGSTSDFKPADGVTQVEQMLDKNSNVKEPKRLLFFRGAIYQATRNKRNSNGFEYYNAQTLIMLDTPSQEDLENFKPITLYACPPGSKVPSSLYFEDVPSAETVENEWKWKKVMVTPTGEECQVTGRSNYLTAVRKQYTLTHPGASTVSSIIH